ncbi:MAG: AMP-binding protein, partial [Candidatus Marinimicrobia bacterium]|nr:AMP-binding protein [Candidatus Neomarinimicrobiota bacterium]
MLKRKVFNPSVAFSTNAHIKNIDQYNEEYQKSITNNNQFWAKKADRLSWIKKWDSIGEYDFVKANIKWFEGGKLNVSYNCIDRHVESGLGDKTALIWEGNNPEEDQNFTYSELLIEVQKFSNVLKKLGVEKGDRVCIYMQMVPQLAIAMLSCARIGAVHSIVFGAFSPDSLRDRI